jgi:hypothetical protein
MLLSTVAIEDWEDLAKMVGCNGVLLYVGALLWWGEAAAGEENASILLAEWKVTVEDVAQVLVRAKEAVRKRCV